ncbi:PP2C family protein-serine/threonine phosphatase [Oceanidesulfovibrio indonesiensis]|uniref:PP2C family protein-serine/threonine phosphatase n=1 Tax=Oceanidesulfovibrio indonesiensis TaxID=54767 RepID=UPI001430A310|nr:protein phosphatase 2C domain-containing protein [Oceanidesulfovibrio indonesiensis]
MPIVIHTHAFGITDVGRRRDTNQDTFLIDRDLGLFVVADGMGGRQGGGVASQLVTETVSTQLRRHLARDAPAPDPNDPVFVDDEERQLARKGRLLKGAVLASNRAVFEKSSQHAALRGMGSTLAAVLLNEDVLEIANVGDSPIYLLRGGAIHLVSVIHTVEAEHAAKIASGELAADSPPLDKRYRHVLTRAVGVAPGVKVQMRELRFYDGDQLLLCSDGLSNKVDPDEMLDVAERNNPEATCRKLVNLANERGGEDNICVVNVRLGIEDVDGEDDEDELLRLKPSIFTIMGRLLGKG